MRNRGRLFAIVLAVASFTVASPAPRLRAASSLPSSITDQEFWTLTEQLSEPNGFFRSDNFLSNEIGYQRVIAGLTSKIAPGGVYLGVGPEQNFPYIAALKPAMAFIIDIRRGNLHEQLLYKALFEMSADRAEFLSRLFSRARPAGLSTTSSVSALFAAYDGVRPSDALYTKNAHDVIQWLTTKHHFALSDDDVQGVEYVYHDAFYVGGPSLTYSMGRGGGGMPTYQDSHARRRWHGTESRLPRIRGDLRLSQGTRNEESRRAGRRGFRRAQSHSRGRRVHQGSRRDGRGVLSVQRRTVPGPGRHLGQLLRERCDASARRHKHVHLQRQRRSRRRGRRIRPWRRDGTDEPSPNPERSDHVWRQMNGLNWHWIALMATGPFVLGVLVAFPIWLTKQMILGNLAGTFVIFAAAIALILRESVTINRLTQECLDAGFTCWPHPSAFLRYSVYACIGLIEVIVVFTVSLEVEQRIRNRNYAPEWR